jgi:hypothetical protein
MKTIRKLWHAWTYYGQMLGDAIARVILTVFYFTIFAPFGLGVRLAGDPLDLKSKSAPKWSPRRTSDLTLDDARRLS